MSKCTCCKGTGIQHLTVNNVCEGTTEYTDIDCVWCDGTGQMDLKQTEIHTEYSNMWCKCKLEWESTYYEDGEHPKLHKHHWRCDCCGDVTQIG